jgi:hypothetical protein
VESSQVGAKDRVTVGEESDRRIARETAQLVRGEKRLRGAGVGEVRPAGEEDAAVRAAVVVEGSKERERVSAWQN